MSPGPPSAPPASPRDHGPVIGLGAFVLGTPDPARLAAFYRELLGWTQQLRIEGGDPSDGALLETA